METELSYRPETVGVWWELPSINSFEKLKVKLQYGNGGCTQNTQYIKILERCHLT